MKRALSALAALVLLLSVLSFAAADEIPRDANLTGTWIIDREQYVKDAYGFEPGTADFDAKLTNIPGSWTFGDDGTFVWHFEDRDDVICAWKQQEEGRSVTVTSPSGISYTLTYAFGGEDRKTLKMNDSAADILCTKAEEPAAGIPSSEWVLSSGEWWLITGYPDLAEYYTNRADAFISMNAENGTFVYTEVVRSAPGRAFVTLEGTYADDGKSLQVDVAGVELSVDYTLAEDTLSLSANGVTAVFTRKTAAESVSGIPTSSWTLTGGTWWNAVGQPDLRDYYENRAAVSLSFDADKGTVFYAETGIETKNIYFSLDGTYTADETTATVQGGGMELTVNYRIDGNTLTVTNTYGTGVFTEAE